MVRVVAVQRRKAIVHSECTGPRETAYGARPDGDVASSFHRLSELSCAHLPNPRLSLITGIQTTPEGPLSCGINLLAKSYSAPLCPKKTNVSGFSLRASCIAFSGSNLALVVTCRICSAPAEPDQPLFHPCRCSGSIRYIHQDWWVPFMTHCGIYSLMVCSFTQSLKTWLAHSKKKTCDICKHPYSFEKGTCRIMLRSPGADKWSSLFTGHAREAADHPPSQTAFTASLHYGNVHPQGCSCCDCVAGSGPVGDRLDMEDVLHLRKLGVSCRYCYPSLIALSIVLRAIVPGGSVADWMNDLGHLLTCLPTQLRVSCSATQRPSCHTQLFALSLPTSSPGRLLPPLLSSPSWPSSFYGSGLCRTPVQASSKIPKGP